MFAAAVFFLEFSSVLHELLLLRRISGSEVVCEFGTQNEFALGGSCCVGRSNFTSCAFPRMQKWIPSHQFGKTFHAEHVRECYLSFPPGARACGVGQQ